MDCSPPGSSVHGIFQARVPEWVAISFSRGSSQPRDRTQVSRAAGRRFTLWAIREAQLGSSPPGKSSYREDPEQWKRKKENYFSKKGTPSFSTSLGWTSSSPLPPPPSPGRQRQVRWGSQFLLPSRTHFNFSAVCFFLMFVEALYTSWILILCLGIYAATIFSQPVTFFFF